MSGDSLRSHRFLNGRGDRVFSGIVIEAELEDYALASAFLIGVDLRALCTDEEVQVARAFFESMNEDNPARMFSFGPEELAIT